MSSVWKKKTRIGDQTVTWTIYISTVSSFKSSFNSDTHLQASEPAVYMWLFVSSCDRRWFDKGNTPKHFEQTVWLGMKPYGNEGSWNDLMVDLYTPMSELRLYGWTPGSAIETTTVPDERIGTIGCQSAGRSVFLFVTKAVLQTGLHEELVITCMKRTAHRQKRSTPELIKHLGTSFEFPGRQCT